MIKYTSLLRLLGIAAHISMIISLTGCFGDSCSQDYLPPEEITTSDNPYHISILSTNLSIVSARWVNITNGESGGGSVTQVYECFFPFGCGTWTRVEWDVSLTTGLNTVYTYERSGGCDWRDDYLITYN